MPREFDFDTIELALDSRNKPVALEQAVAAEGQAMLRAIGDGGQVIALDVKGEPWSTEQLVGRLSAWQLPGGNFSLLVGGTGGLAPACSAWANLRWPLLPLTLPTPWSEYCWWNSSTGPGPATPTTPITGNTRLRHDR